MLKQDLEDLLAEPFRSVRETIVGQSKLEQHFYNKDHKIRLIEI